MEAIRRSARKSWMSYRKLRDCSCTFFCRICLEDFVTLLCTLCVSAIIFQFYSVMRISFILWDLYMFGFRGAYDMICSILGVETSPAERPIANGTTVSTSTSTENPTDSSVKGKESQENQPAPQDAPKAEESSVKEELEKTPEVPDPKPILPKSVKRKHDDSESDSEFPVISSTRMVMSPVDPIPESKSQEASKQDSPKQISFQKDSEKQADVKVESKEETTEVVEKGPNSGSSEDSS